MHKDIVFCNECGKQMTVFDSDGDAVHNGYELVGKFSISENFRTNSGSSHRRLVEVTEADICSLPCMKARLSTLVTLLEIAS